MSKEQYSLRVKNEKLIHYNRLGLFILLIHFFYFILHLLRSPEQYIIPVIGILTSLGWILINRTVWKNRNNPTLPFWGGSLLLAILWFNLQYPGFASALIVLAILDALARRKPILVFTSEHISLPFLFKSSVAWSDLNNVILKDGILTLDYKNDHLFQSEIDERDGLVDEKAFNSFCSLALTAKTQGQEGTQG